MIECKFKHYLDSYKTAKRKAFILCTGKTLKEYESKIRKYIVKERVVRFGVNNLPSWYPVDFHLWTSNERLIDHYDCIKSGSVLMFGQHIKNKNIPKFVKTFVRIPCEDRDENESFGYKNGKILGFYRTSGAQLIMICHLMGFKEIVIAGMDGFTYEYNGNGTHYYTDKPEKIKDRDTNWNCYDKWVARALQIMSTMGINFKIITPSIFNEYVDKNIIMEN